MTSLKSKMKKSDPENFTIHDFLGECKTGDSADTRFDDSLKSARGDRKYFVLGTTPSKLGNVYREVGSRMSIEKGWSQKKDDTGRFHLIFGGPKGSGIPFKRFAQLFKWDYGIVPHCNSFRGNVWLTQKVKLTQVLRQANLDSVMPESYLYFPSSSEDNETDDFRVACESNAKRSSKPSWIAKATDASKGERTLLSDDFDEIMNLLASQDKTSSPWSVQRYITNPLLLPGDRKFDLRYYVLVDSSLNAYLSTEATVKTCSAPFSMSDLDNTKAHISNHVVQGSKSEDFPIEQLAKWLSSEHSVSYETNILDQVKQILYQVINAAKSKLENVEHADFTSFQIFAFDFLIDSTMKVWFLEACSPTDFPEEFVQDFASDVLDIAIKPVFATRDGDRDDEERGHAHAGGVAFRPLAAPMPRTSRGNNKK